MVELAEALDVLEDHLARERGALRGVVDARAGGVEGFEDVLVLAEDADGLKDLEDTVFERLDVVVGEDGSLEH